MRARLLLPPAMLFLLSAVTMAAELVAPRRMAPLLGTGSLLWAGIIGAFLLGLAVGYAWGGRLADRPRRGQLPLLLLLAAGATWLACGPADWLPGFQLGLADGGTLPAMLAILLSYAPLAIVMGLPLPALTRAALAEGRRVTTIEGLRPAHIAAGAKGGASPGDDHHTHIRIGLQIQ